jgi:pimeloyl-ACP methyl ester carboxylesterase
VSAAQLRWVRITLGVVQRFSSRLAARLAFRLFLTPGRRRLDAVDAETVQQARIHELACGHGHVRVYEWGSGPRTVVILHGWGSHAPRFAPLASALAAAGWRVLAPDAPGHGRSPGGNSSLPQFIDTLDAIADGFGPLHALVGHSLGALAVTLWLSRRGDRAMPELRRVVLISMPSGAPFLIDSFHQMFGIGDATRRHMAVLFRRRFGADPQQFAVGTHVRNIAVPVLLIHDLRDDVVPVAQSQQLHAHFPNGQFHATEGLGHSGLLRNAETIRQIEDFLGSD